MSDSQQQITQVIVDGGDGTGKSTLVEQLRARGYAASDRGLVTKMTLDDSIEPESNALYIILDVPVEVALARLEQAGKPMDEEWHQPQSLRHFRERYRELAARIPSCHLVDATPSADEVLAEVLAILYEHDIPTST